MAKRWTEAENEYLKQYYPTSRAQDIAVILGRSESAVQSQLIRLGMVKRKPPILRGSCLEPLKSKPRNIKSKYRYDITDTTCMQLCIGDFEGLSRKVLCDLYSVNPRCLPRMLEDLRRTGEYRRYIEEFEVCNPACYDRAVKRWKRKRRVGGLTNENSILPRKTKWEYHSSSYIR